MIIKFREDANRQDIDFLREHLLTLGFEVHETIGDTYTIFSIIGDTTRFDANSLYAFKFVETVVRIQEPYKKVSRKYKPTDTIVDVAGVKIGGNNVVIIGGPCAVETREQMDLIASLIKTAGARILRAGAYKPRTSPYSFQGLEQKGLLLLSEVRKKYHLPVVSEILSAADIPLFLDSVDMIQVGARNMQNYALLKELGKIKLPILLKRGLSNTIEEWLMSAEYIVSGGNENVVLCERGIRTFESSTRSTLDISAIPVIKKISHLPIIVDPSHASGSWEYVASLSQAAIAAGADGLLIEVHPEPEKALSDGQQSLKPDRFADLVIRCRSIAEAIDRTLI
ncbi:MAG: 3-deoxy-7-phosphoheptulonate synthase [Candidatus Izemoplasmatales bacterium]|jgi:3-deoxy-7-phosphoheptulonate synthase|nr:3-deoxy-7-phosphoheptulonate synthase [Candidatus Izemoplasmatales bacterium]MDD3865474.1 3-deoxy-7-phosphoheptulonate synthase [Candidatus Izemoplasmatales bacterium]